MTVGPLWGLNPDTPLHGSLYGDRGYISQDLRGETPKARDKLGLQSPKEHGPPGRISIR